jgi:hypothetical protein
VNSGGTDPEWQRPGWERIAADGVITSSTSALTFSSIPATVRHLRLEFSLKPTVNGSTGLIQVSQSGVFNTAGNYLWTYDFGNSNAAVGAASPAAGTGWNLLAGATQSSDANTGGIRGYIELYDLQTAGKVSFVSQAGGFHTGDGFAYTVQSWGYFNVAGAIDGVRFNYVGGNIATAQVSCLALRE